MTLSIQCNYWIHFHNFLGVLLWIVINNLKGECYVLLSMWTNSKRHRLRRAGCMWKNIWNRFKDDIIKHFFLVAGYDGAKTGSNYYTEFIEKVPKDFILLILACEKYRLISNLVIQGISRVFFTQDNAMMPTSSCSCKGIRSYSKRAARFLIISCYEQKAVGMARPPSASYSPGESAL